MMIRVFEILVSMFLLNAFHGWATAQTLTPFTDRALKYFQSRDYKSAVVELKQAVQKEPRDAFAWCILGASYANLKDYKEAVEALRKSLSLDPTPRWGEINERMVRALLAEAEQNARATSGVKLQQTLGPLTEPADFETLPTGFTGANPKNTVAQFRKVIAEIPFKIDQYSTPTERAQFNQLAIQKFEPMGLLRFVLTKESTFWYKSYDANNQSFRFNLIKVTSSSLTWSGSSSLGAAQIVLTRDRKTLGTYEASNAFGAKRTITRFSDTDISIAFRASSYLDKAGDDPQSIVKQSSISGGSYEFVVPLNSAEARQSADDISCLVLFKPTFPYLLDYKNHHSPTIQSPYDIETVGTALIGKFEELWVVNQRTGKIYAKFK